MKIIVFGDCHGRLPQIREEFDLLCICGDILPTSFNDIERILYQQIFFLQGEFKTWIENLPYKDEYSRVVFIGGNHDFFLQNEKSGNLIGDDRIVYLNSNSYLYHHPQRDLTVYGEPHCKKFGEWAFMDSPSKLKKIYDKIPNGVDILLVHDAPQIGEVGVIGEGINRGRDCGNKILYEAIREKKPRYVFCGHIHSGDHDEVRDGETVYRNVSILDERYQRRWDPYIFEL